MVHKKWNIHAFRRSSNRTVLETISVDHCRKEWSCWTLCSRARDGRPSFQWLKLITSETVRMLSLRKAYMFYFLCTTLHSKSSLEVDFYAAETCVCLRMTKLQWSVAVQVTAHHLSAKTRGRDRHGRGWLALSWTRGQSLHWSYPTASSLPPATT